MRELALWGDEAGLESAFPDIAALAAGCRFADCAHDSEPGCAVRAAVDSGALAGDRFASWQKLQRELRWLERRLDARARAEEEGTLEGDHEVDEAPPEGGEVEVREIRIQANGWV